MKKLLLIIPLVACVRLQSQSPTRLTKFDKENLIHMLAEPIRKIEQKIDTINQAANQIQNFIVDNYNQPVDQELKNQYEQILSRIAHLGLLVEALVFVIQAQTQYIQEVGQHVGDLEYAVASLESHLVNLETQVADIQASVGSLSDISVGEEDFNSVTDIDEAQLSLVSWTKTEYREQLHDKFIS